MWFKSNSVFEILIHGLERVNWITHILFLVSPLGFGTSGNVTQWHFVQKCSVSKPGGPHFPRVAAQPCPGPAVSKKGMNKTVLFIVNIQSSCLFTDLTPVKRTSSTFHTEATRTPSLATLRCLCHIHCHAIAITMNHRFALCRHKCRRQEEWKIL